MTHNFSRRTLLKLTGLAGMNAYAQSQPDYKALVCVFLFGGNDGHNTVIPREQSEWNAYRSIRGGLALPDGNGPLLDVSAKNGSPYALNSGLSQVHPLWGQGRLAVVSNVGNLVQPLTRAEYLGGGVALPSNLFSHSDQTQQMQTGGQFGTGWAGRVADQVQPLNGSSTFPASISVSGQALFCAGSIVQSASLIPGFDLAPSGMNVWPATAVAARMNGLQSVLTLDSGLSLIQSANQVRQDALTLSGHLRSLASNTPLRTPFPGTGLGRQLQQVAQIMQLRQTLGLRRQVFFCSMGGFDTHSSQAWAHWDLLRQLSESLNAFYLATEEMGIADRVTSFTESEFGRTLQPSGSGTDHGWGNHFLVLGGAVKGGDVYGSFPRMALGGPDDASGRGALLPSTSLDQFGATFAKWFGVPDSALNTVFPNLKNFPVRDLGFLSGPAA
jgi:uncharacterized protein (DUF1501 family)